MSSKQTKYKLPGLEEFNNPYKDKVIFLSGVKDPELEEFLISAKATIAKTLNKKVNLVIRNPAKKVTKNDELAKERGIKIMSLDTVVYKLDTESHNRKVNTIPVERSRKSLVPKDMTPLDLTLLNEQSMYQMFNIFMSKIHKAYKVRDIYSKFYYVPVLQAFIVVVRSQSTEWLNAKTKEEKAKVAHLSDYSVIEFIVAKKGGTKYSFKMLDDVQISSNDKRKKISQVEITDFIAGEYSVKPTSIIPFKYIESYIERNRGLWRQNALFSSKSNK